jgi:hypothetical protein
MQNKEIWDKLKTPPQDALRTIKAGRLKGMSDISPQWRYEIMTDVFGPCGIGWSVNIERLWTEQGFGGQVLVFAHVSVTYKNGDEWSQPVHGVGGSFLVKLEKKGPYASDECYKMAITDATGTALKMIGVAADVYAGKCNDSKNSMNDNQEQGVW